MNIFIFINIKTGFAIRYRFRLLCKLRQVKLMRKILKIY